MIKKFFILLTFIIAFLLSNHTVLADDVRPGGFCAQGGGSVCCNSTTGTCINDGSYQCLPNSSGVKYDDGSTALSCQPSSVGKVFGKINPPDAIKGLLEGDPTGAGGISKLLSNLVALFYVIAAVVLVLMLIWGAFDWMTSEGEKEKLEGAKKKIINAIIGIMLFALAFAIIQLLGKFTGFTFFVGQR